MPALQISDLQFKQASKSLKFGANCGTQVGDKCLKDSFREMHAGGGCCRATLHTDSR
jgi:hypothetical protein